MLQPLHRWLRDLMPSWHAKERAFREWYTNLVDSCDLNGAQDPARYNLWLEIFKSPEPVTGYRDVRYPKQEAAAQKSRRTPARGSANGGARRQIPRHENGEFDRPGHGHLPRRVTNSCAHAHGGEGRPLKNCSSTRNSRPKSNSPPAHP